MQRWQWTGESEVFSSVLRCAQRKRLPTYKKGKLQIRINYKVCNQFGKSSTQNANRCHGRPVPTEASQPNIQRQQDGAHRLKTAARKAGHSCVDEPTFFSASTGLHPNQRDRTHVIMLGAGAWQPAAAEAVG